MVIGIIFIIILLALGFWQITSKWRIYRQLKLHGFLVQARVTDIKSEARLVTQTGSATSTYQRLKYEDFLYAQWQDPITQTVHKFRIKIPDSYQFHVGESLSLRMNRKNPNEYQIEYSKRAISEKMPMPKGDIIDHDYQQGYRSSTERTEVQNSILSDLQEYEEPKASYPQQLLEQKNDRT